jgi:hypothetical protein
MYLLPEYVHDRNNFYVTGRMTEGSWFDPWQGQDVFLFSKRPDWHWGLHKRLSSGYRGLFSREL